MPRPSANQPTPRDVLDIKAKAAALAERADAAGWYEILSKIYRASVEHSLGLHKDDPRIRVVRGLNDTIDIVQVGGPYAGFHANLGMSDAALKQCFHAWLKIAREYVPQPRTGRGTDNLSSRIGAAQFKRWRDARVVEFAHLLIWRAKDQAGTRCSNATLAGWIERSSPKEIKATKKALVNALDCLPMLAGECERALLKADDKDTHNALAESIKSDLSSSPWSFLRYIRTSP